MWPYAMPMCKTTRKKLRNNAPFSPKPVQTNLYKCGQITGMAACDQVAVLNHLLIHIFRTRIFDILYDGFPSCGLSAPEDIGRYQQLGCMTDGEDRLTTFNKFFCKCYGIIICPQFIRRIPARNQECVKFLIRYLFYGLFNLDEPFLPVSNRYEPARARLP